MASSFSDKGKSWALYTEENVKKNKLGKKNRMNCKIVGDMIEYDKGEVGWKNSIRLNHLDEVVMHEKYTLNRLKYENIICLKRGKDIKFLKADSKSQMEAWYSELMKALQRFGWITDTELECTIDGKKRRATNPEGIRRPNVVRAKRNAVSACEGLEGGFYSEPYTETTESSGTDSGSDESPHSSPTDIRDEPQYEDRFHGPPNNHPTDKSTFMNVASKKPQVPVRKESIPARKIHTSPSHPARVPVESDENEYMGLLPLNDPPPTPPAAEATAAPVESNNDFKTKQAMLQNMLSTNAKGSLPSTKSTPNAGRLLLNKSHAPPPSTHLPTHPMQPPMKPTIPVPPKPNVDESTPRSIRQVQSFRLPSTSSKPKPTMPMQRRGSVPHPPRVIKDEATTGAATRRPQLPQRHGQSLLSSVETFRSKQEEDSIELLLPKDAIRKGKRICFVKVKGLHGLWIDHWDPNGPPLEETLHPGDQILSINDIDLDDSGVKFAHELMEKAKGEEIRMNVCRAPHANVLLLKRTADKRDLGIEIDGVVIKKVHPGGLFQQSTKGKATGVLSPDRVEWAITEINMQPVHSKSTTKQVHTLLEKAGPDVALVIQPSDLILAMKEALNHCPKCGGASHTCLP